ncbi:MAG: hypothetical protein F6K23_02195 [Okeania sp. SIO2C9]|uniref:hypothetical protein n=1 Tax=Okeania sp. SIO2C9 TaxID=2607791 RepID=UPI0013C07138|nr:hypothetical protein [Okeania sp. SIO2C9]NEQ71986.1 hypothetical protein [Okeania sp. SIO2C9]
MGIWGDGRWGYGEMGRWGDGRWRDGDMGAKGSRDMLKYSITIQKWYYYRPKA